jgi:hypothetical protein
VRALFIGCGRSARGSRESESLDDFAQMIQRRAMSQTHGEEVAWKKVTGRS